MGLNHLRPLALTNALLNNGIYQSRHHTLPCSVAAMEAPSTEKEPA